MKIKSSITMHLNNLSIRYSEKEVANKVNMFRKMLMAKEGVSESSAVDKDEHGRPM